VRTTCILAALGLLLVLALGAQVPPRGLGAQQPDTAAPAGPGRGRPEEAGQRLQAQARAQLRLLEIQKR
jgi:hypothetical protein